jgi:hypothetical protein
VGAVVVHVRQYETWGPLFLPAYLMASLIAALRGRHFYFDNAFEVEAYRAEPPAGQNRSYPHLAAGRSMRSTV